MDNKIRKEILDVTEFINSCDIRGYYRKINYEFSSLEAAYLVYMSYHHTLKQKLKAYNIIIQTTSDCPVREQLYRECDSFHGLLKKHIENINKYLEYFYKQESDTIYYLDYNGRHYNYSTYQECYESLEYHRVKEEIIEHNKMLPQVKKVIYVTKKYICKEMEGMEILTLFDSEDNVVNVYTSPHYAHGYRIGQELPHPLFYNEDDEEINFSLCFYCFDFPIPFEKGDIVQSAGNPYYNPFVFKGVTADFFDDETIAESYPVDMKVFGIFLTDHGEVFSDTIENFMEIEYYRGSLNGRLEKLKKISDEIKGVAPSGVDLG